MTRQNGYNDQIIETEVVYQNTCINVGLFGCDSFQLC